jgi:hypothetical protein
MEVLENIKGKISREKKGKIQQTPAVADPSVKGELWRAGKKMYLSVPL